MKKLSKSARITTITLLIIVVAVVGALAALQMRENRNDGATDDTSYSGPTEQEKQSADDIKDEVIAEEKNNTPPSNANIVFADASYYRSDPAGSLVEVRAYVSNAVEAGGTCKVTLVGDKTYTKSVPAEKDAQTTWCQTVSFPVSQAAFNTAQNWTATLEYESPTLTGKNETKVMAAQ